MANKRVRRFIDEFSNIKLEDFFQLPNTKNEKVVINFEVETLQLILVSIHYKKNYHYPCFNLPPEIANHIKGYIPDILHIKLKVTIPGDYPFKPHLWEILHIHTNLKINEIKYYDIMNEHNCYNTGDWSPSISLDKDILCLIEKYYNYLYRPN